MSCGVSIYRDGRIYQKLSWKNYISSLYPKVYPKSSPYLPLLIPLSPNPLILPSSNPILLKFFQSFLTLLVFICSPKIVRLGEAEVFQYWVHKMLNFLKNLWVLLTQSNLTQFLKFLFLLKGCESQYLTKY